MVNLLKNQNRLKLQLFVAESFFCHTFTMLDWYSYVPVGHSPLLSLLPHPKREENLPAL